MLSQKMMEMTKLQKMLTHATKVTAQPSFSTITWLMRLEKEVLATFYKILLHVLKVMLRETLQVNGERFTPTKFGQDWYRFKLDSENLAWKRERALNKF